MVGMFRKLPKTPTTWDNQTMADIEPNGEGTRTVL